MYGWYSIKLSDFPEHVTRHDFWTIDRSFTGPAASIENKTGKIFIFFLIFQIKVLNFNKLQYIWAILYSFEHCKSHLNWHLNKCSYLEPITVVLIKFALWHINGTIAKFFIQWFRHRFFWKILLRSKYCMPKIPFFKFFVSLYHSFSKNIEWLHLNTSTTDYFVVVSTILR